MTTSFARADDEKFMSYIRALATLGVDVTVVTSEQREGFGAAKVVRTVTVSWQTHNADAAVI